MGSCLYFQGNINQAAVIYMDAHPNITYTQLIALYEVSRKINSELNFDKLLDEIMDLAIELLDAERGVLLLRQTDTLELKVEVARRIDKQHIDEAVALSRSVIGKVESEGKPVLLQNVPDVVGKSPTSSLIRQKIKSVICVPLLSKAHLLGAIYLDTTDTSHFFKNEDLAFLEGFANLAAVAIENARSYQEIHDLNETLETRVRQRTEEVQLKHEELKQAYGRLQETQTQLLRSEKMASLGLLVAGVAHEINTPLASITSNMDTFIRTFGKLRGCERELSEQSSNTIATLAKLAKVNENACCRINAIVKSLRTFARLDEEVVKPVDIHEGLNDTLDLTAHLSRDRITVIKEYGVLPKLRCRANQLNQVFMNILVNACQAIEGLGEIKIRTSQKNENIQIEISDSGKGIPAESLSKIFDPGFTTKGVGVGTGLGLSISYKIVEEHHGTVNVASEIGKGTTFTLILPAAGLPSKGTNA